MAPLVAPSGYSYRFSTSSTGFLKWKLGTRKDQNSVQPHGSPGSIFFFISCASSQEKINDSGGFCEFPWKTAKAGVVSILIFTAYVTCYQDHAMKNLGENHQGHPYYGATGSWPPIERQTVPQLTKSELFFEICQLTQRGVLGQ